MCDLSRSIRVRRFSFEVWADAAAEVCTSLDLCSGDIGFGVVGRLQRWKGQHAFLEAAAMVFRQHPGARFRIVGDALFGLEPEYGKALGEQAKRLGIEEVVRFTGFRDDIPAILGA